MRHVYLCLGKESITYQDLVFFIAFDLKLHPPSICEKLISKGKEENLLDISTDKIVTFKVKMLLQKQQGKSPPSVEQIMSEMTDEMMINKAFGINDDRILGFDIDAKKSLLTARFSGDAGKTIEVMIDGMNKIVRQDHDDDVAPFKGKKVFLKYLFKILAKKKDDPDMVQLLRQIHGNVKNWRFEYKKVE